MSSLGWTGSHRVVIDYDRRRVTAYTPADVCVMFQRISTMLYPKAYMILDGMGS